jgi:ABC-2 type transport system ATP-binding protein
MKDVAVNIVNLDFKYPENSGTYFKDFNLSIVQGERFGLFGPNGAGKSTLMNLMTGLLHPLKGKIELLGIDIAVNNNKAKTLFGFVPQDFSFYHELSPVENFQFFGAWAGLSSQTIKTRTNELLEVLGLSHVRDKQVSTFSGGMKRRVNLAIGVIHTPQVLFLDEPTVGVDVQTRHAIIDYLKELNKQGMTLVYTSHQLSEAEELCDRVALMDHGKIIACNSLSYLYNEYTETDLEGLFIHLTGNAYRDNV